MQNIPLQPFFQLRVFNRKNINKISNKQDFFIAQPSERSCKQIKILFFITEHSYALLSRRAAVFCLLTFFLFFSQKNALMMKEFTTPLNQLDWIREGEIFI
jgi:hypothetical protein